MNDEDLKKLWQQQPLRKPTLSADQVVSAMQNKTTQLRRTLLARDAREVAVCVIVATIFGIFYFAASRTATSRLGDLIIIGSSIFIAFKLIYTRRRNPPAGPNAAVAESLRAELNAVRAQSQLLGSIHWWYLLPLGIGILVGTWGSVGGLGGLVFGSIYTLAVIALYVWIYRLNQRARAEQLLPVEDQLELLIRSAETGEPLDETEGAKIRPIVLSMEAVDKVKPVEFKVDFWQLAIFGVPGIVGIWFFLMLSLTMDNREWKAKEQIAEGAASSVRVEQTNRHSVVAQKVVDLFNAGDYAAVQRLYNAEMNKAFAPRETTNFYARIAERFGKVENFDVVPGGSRWLAFQLHCERGGLTMSLALDSQDKIAGIYFAPEGKSSSFKSFVLELFSWRHLAWFPAFLLGGLLYSWLMQKLTKRAVGISALGVHLCKGQTLILWEEIKEVRPFKFLHIRNLWLIKDSGEKTLMHWTPLERHSDLKAAVESFAPANHPLRKYLPLLRGIR